MKRDTWPPLSLASRVQRKAPSARLQAQKIPAAQRRYTSCKLGTSELAADEIARVITNYGRHYGARPPEQTDARLHKTAGARAITSVFIMLIIIIIIIRPTSSGPIGMLVQEERRRSARKM